MIRETYWPQVLLMVGACVAGLVLDEPTDGAGRLLLSGLAVIANGVGWLILLEALWVGLWFVLRGPTYLGRTFRLLTLVCNAGPVAPRRTHIVINHQRDVLPTGYDRIAELRTQIRDGASLEAAFTLADPTAFRSGGSTRR